MFYSWNVRKEWKYIIGELNLEIGDSLIYFINLYFDNEVFISLSITEITSKNFKFMQRIMRELEYWIQV